ncbi:MAG: hypothetical protein H0X03_00690 [Nitrosopumilus sp.]|nr:hypothetical protein [Nitrosopumilus sp.]
MSKNPIKNSLVKGVIFGNLTIIVYLLIVIFTTPNLSPTNTIIAAFKANSMIIVGLGVGIGIQIFISNYSKSLGCQINKRKSILGSGAGSTVLSSFFSFFSLVPLGCCGSWLLILSLLPSIFGTTVSIALIEYSKMLSYLSLALVFGLALLSIYRLHRRLKDRNKIMDGNMNRFDQLQKRNE